MRGSERTGERKPVQIDLAGLSIWRGEVDEPHRAGHDLVWRHRQVEAVLGEAPGDGPFTILREEAGGDGPLTVSSFGHGGRIRCRFAIASDGRSVESLADPDVSDRDMLALFGEYILRTVLVRRGLLSFHAAALSDGEGAILIAGDKGMGKSTLSSALQQRGWSCVADDLARVSESDGAWRVFAGLRQSKLLADSIAALGLEQELLPPRWEHGNGAHDDKRLLSPVVDLPVGNHAYRLTALVILKPRGSGSELRHRIASPVDAVRGMLEHVTEDPLTPGGGPSPPVQRAIGALAGRIPVVEISLPDRLDVLQSSADGVEAIVRAVDQRRSA